MRIDWIVAIVTFLVFVSWAFSYYYLLNSAPLASRSVAAMSAGEKVVDFLESAFTSIPANITFNYTSENVTLWSYINWTGASLNSTRIVTSSVYGSALPCLVSGDIIYWKANLTEGQNLFFLEFSDSNGSMSCSSQISTSGANRTSLWARERGNVFSWEKMTEVCGMLENGYDDALGNIGIVFDISVLMENGTSSMECGPPVPIGDRDIFVYTSSGRLWEGGSVNISVRSWQ